MASLFHQEESISPKFDSETKLVQIRANINIRKYFSSEILILMDTEISAVHYYKCRE